MRRPKATFSIAVRLQLREQIRALQTCLQITTVFVTHDQEEALSMADRVCVMQQGRVEQVDVPSVLYTHPATPFVAEFVGTMNRLRGRIAGGGVAVLGRVLPVRGDQRPAPGTDVEVLLRPEELDLSPAPDDKGIVMGRPSWARSRGSPSSSRAISRSRSTSRAPRQRGSNRTPRWSWR